MIIDDLRQRHLEAFEAEYNRLFSDKSGRNTERGATVRAAKKAGWLINDPGDVAEMLPREVAKLAKAINERYVEVMTIDPN